MFLNFFQLNFAQVVLCPMTERQITAYKNIINSFDADLILRRKDKCDCGREQERGKCCHRGDFEKEGITQNAYIIFFIILMSYLPL
jgi:hypothetical protein